MPGTIVIGGGFAGLAAATALCERGEPVTLLEARAFLGGKVYSFEDKAAGHAVDNGQHAFLKGYRNTLALLERWGTVDLVTFQPTLDITFVGPQGEMPFRCAPLPAPLHLLWPLLRFKALSWRDRLTMARPALSLMAMPEHARRALDGSSFGDWLRKHGQSQRAIASFWDPLALAAVNGSVENISAFPALQVLMDGFLSSQSASRFGYANQGLSSLFEGFPAFLTEHGGTLRLGTRVQHIEPRSESAWRVRLVGDETLEADRVILAVPPVQLAKMLPEDLRSRPPFAEAAQLETAPIVSVQMTFDRPIMERSVVALLDSPIHWVFNAGRIRKDAPEGAVALVMSGAQSWLGVPNDHIQAMALEELKKRLPASAEARLISCRVVKEIRATVDCKPGSEALRPGTETGLPGLYLAGAWTATGFPSTIEGAVISGLKAVEALEADRGTSCRLAEPLDQPDALAAVISAGLSSVVRRSPSLATR